MVCFFEYWISDWSSKNCGCLIIFICVCMTSTTWNSSWRKMNPWTPRQPSKWFWTSWHITRVTRMVLLLFSSLTPTAIDYNPNVSATMQQPSSVVRLDYNQLLLVWVKKTITWIEHPTTQVFTKNGSHNYERIAIVLYCSIFQFDQTQLIFCFTDPFSL